ncbi:Ig-like domain-containing protein [Vallitalea guaymasensis]|uniref:Ig-like domain-containing protein n=1 Tax=Vallitalea guaymasensis TaxID=1185412 RepID=UPI000DE43C1F|nr:Ig-like domain-containing protein [Vallitalea guaymasensis]
MKKFKKALAFMLTFAMLFSSFTIANAADRTKTDAEIVESLNMLRGDGEGVTSEYLAKKTTRLQAAIMFLRLQGLEQEAINFEGIDNFSDADSVYWAGGKSILAYLKAHPELGWVGNGKGFAPNQTITAQAYYKVMLEALGYKQGIDFEWNNVLSFAATKGLSKSADVKIFTNNDIATVTVEALKTTNKEGMRLIDALIEAEVIDKDVAKELDFGPFPQDANMTDARAIDAKTIKLVFDEEINLSAEDVRITDSSGHERSILDIDLVDNEKVAIIEVSELSIGKKYTVNFGEISKTIVPTVKEDKTEPKIIHANAITGTLLRVVIGTRNVNKDTLIEENFSLNNDASILGVKLDEVEMNEDGNENNTILLMDVNGLKTGKAFTVKSSNVTSYKGLSADSDDSKAIFAGKDPDTKAPKLAGAVSEAGYKVIVTFLEDALLDEDTATDISNYSISNDIDIIDAKIDKNAVGGDTKVVLTTSDQKSGVAYTLKVSDISDGTNIMKDTEKTVFAGKDKAKNQKVIGAVSLDSNKVEVTFEYEANDTALDVSNYSIDKDIEVLEAKFVEDVAKVEKINKKKVILTTTDMKSGVAYKLTVKTGVQDILGQGLKESKSVTYAGKDPDKSFTTSNTAKSLDRNRIQINFGEAVDRVTGTDVSNYEISDLGYPSLVTLDSTSKIATLTVQDQKSGKPYVITINNIKDRAGNVINSNTKLTFTGRGEITDRLKVVNASALSKTKIKLDINELIDTTGSINLDKFKLRAENSNKSFTFVGSERISDYVILTVGTNNLSSNEVYTLTVESGSNLKGRYTGHTFDSTKEEERKAVFVGSDSISPQFAIEKVKVLDKTHIKVSFTDTLKDTATAVVSELSLFTDEEYSNKAKDHNGTIIAYKEAITPIISGDRKSVIFQVPHDLSSGSIYYLEFNNLSNFESETAELAPYKTGANTARHLIVTGDLISVDDTKLDIDYCSMKDKNTLEIRFNVDTKQDLTKDEVVIVNNPSYNTNPTGLEVGYVEFLDARTARIYFTGYEKLNNSNDISYVKVIGTVSSLVGTSTSFGSDKEYESFANNPVDNAKPSIALAEPQSSNVIKVTLSERAYRNSNRDSLQKEDFVIYNKDTNIIIDPSMIRLIPVTDRDIDKVFYIELTHGVFLSGGNYQIGLSGNVIGIDGYVSADAYVPTSDETRYSTNFGGGTDSLDKLTLTDPQNNLLILGGTDAQDDTLEVKAGLGLKSETNYIIGFSSSYNSLAVSKMMFETTASKTFVPTPITGQDKKAKAGERTNIMFYDTAGNKLLNDTVTITLGNLSGPTELPVTASFTDIDNNGEQISGNVTWTAAADETKITHYGVFYVGTDGSKGSQIGADIAKGTTYIVNISADTAIPSNTNRIAVYSKNANGYSATGKEITIVDVDTDLPTQLAATASFTDGDNNGGQISGNVTWTAAADETKITHYGVFYVGTDGSKGSQIGADIAKGTTYIVNISADTAIPSNTNRIAVYSKNANGYSATGKEITIVDVDTDLPTQLAATASFTDGDNNGGQISGNVTWTAAADETKITHYGVFYVGTDGSKGSQIGADIVKGTTYIVNISADTAIPSNTNRIAVYSKNANGYSATGKEITIVDVDTDLPTQLAATASFTDGDNNGGQISGNVTWTAAADETKITHYGVFYVGTDGSKGSQIGADIAKGTTYIVNISADTAIPSNTNRIAVYSKNANGYSATGKEITIVDVDTDLPTGLAATISFIDGDLDENQISGNVTWTAAVDETKITHYGVFYVGTDGSKGNQIGTDVIKGALYNVIIQENTAIPADTNRIAVYSKNVNGYSTTGKEIAIIVPSELAESATFTDSDVNTGEISGNVTWTAANNESNVTHYGVFYVGTDGSKGSQIGTDIAKGATYSITIPENTAIPENTDRIAVFSKNAQGYSETGKAIDITGK